MLEPEYIRQILKAHPPISLERNNFRHAAVLMPIFWCEGEPYLVFTKRSEKVPHHKGQISFPGGSIDVGDVDSWAAAVRETTEEIGLPAGQIQYLGRLDDIMTITGYVISPFVAQIPDHFAYQISDFEIDVLFEAPLRELTDPSRLREEIAIFEQKSYPIYYFEYQQHIIWGATGKILHQFLEITGLISAS